MSPRAHHGPGAIFLIDHDPPRRDAMAAALSTLDTDLEVFTDLDRALESPRMSAERLLVLVALERRAEVGATVARIRSRNAHTTLVALAQCFGFSEARAREDRVPGDRVLDDTPGVARMKGRELLAMAQHTGCDGCLFYTAPTEVLATLRALWDAGSP